jgi:hypothetical protein
MSQADAHVRKPGAGPFRGSTEKSKQLREF